MIVAANWTALVGYSGFGFFAVILVGASFGIGANLNVPVCMV